MKVISKEKLSAHVRTAREPYSLVFVSSLGLYIFGMPCNRYVKIGLGLSANVRGFSG